MNRNIQLLDLIKKYRIMLMAAASIILLTAAAVLFIVNGERSTITLSEAGTDDGTISSEEEKRGEQKVYVDVGGCVEKPGVYEVSAASRIFQVIEKAGGITSDADTSGINQAESVTDGMKILVPDKKSRRTADASGEPAENSSVTEKAEGLVNINTADTDTLQTIPGIGPVTAEKIIDYRDANGYFKNTEDIKNVNGIGEKTYTRICSLITV